MAEGDDGRIRAGEVAGSLPPTFDAQLYFIGRIRSPWTTREDCPRKGDPDTGPLFRLEIEPRWHVALTGLTPGSLIQVLYWMHLSRRDLLLQTPKRDGVIHGTLALRSPVRPNPIASSVVPLLAVEDGTLTVRGLDCIDGTPILDVKPASGPFMGDHT